MNLLFWALTLGTLGKILLAIGILKVHHIMAMEQKIDERVIRSFAFEKTLTLLGVLFIFIGYMMELYFYGFTTSLLTCEGIECGQASTIFFSQ